MFVFGGFSEEMMTSDGRSTQILYFTLPLPEPQCKNIPLQIKVVHQKPYCSKSTAVL